LALSFVLAQATGSVGACQSSRSDLFDGRGLDCLVEFGPVVC